MFWDGVWVANIMHENIHIYTDGSYVPYADYVIGAYLILDMNRMFVLDLQVVTSEAYDLVELCNVGGEMYAVECGFDRALDWILYGLVTKHTITFHYDFKSLGLWVHQGTRSNIARINKYVRTIHGLWSYHKSCVGLKFCWQPGHSGDELHNIVDYVCRRGVTALAITRLEALGFDCDRLYSCVGGCI